jgi:DNA-binding Lrp family transcriptional regulator
MARPKRNSLERERDLERIEAMRIKRMSQSEIAEAVGTSRSQVAYDLKKIRERNAERARANKDEMVGEELANLDFLQKIALQGYEKSKEVRRTETSATEKATAAAKAGAATEGGPLKQKAGLKKEERDGNPTFLAIFLSCIKARREMLGLDAPKKGIGQIDMHHSGSIAMTTEERLGIVTEVRKHLDKFPEARAALQPLFQPRTNGN